MESMEHRGVLISLPPNDDGLWRWIAHYQKGHRLLGIPSAIPRPSYKTRSEAIVAAKQAIDKFLDAKRGTPEG
jgi:hypothetical protein